MVKPSYKLKEIEQRLGDLHTVIPPMVNEMGQLKTALELGVSQFTISKWLKQNGYIAKTTYIRVKKARNDHAASDN